ncbi:MAG: homocysteine S-methyltransferase family protein, partial [Gorillibacterium sp.]|nr:homocysteine S-methyltransferase family protein [Gorillibacterium sp.]
MKPDLRSALQTGFLTGDGAMGTYLYQSGFPVGISYEEFNLVKPNIIVDIHRQYYEAGARIIETNTFSANREKLSKFGLEDETVAINKAGVALARQAVGDDAFVLGAVGSLRGSRRRRIGEATLKHDLAEQITALLEAGADGIILETFYELSEMLIAVQIVRNLGNAPVICQFATDGSGMTQDGVTFDAAFELLQEAGADAVGFNCHSGPDGILRALEKLSAPPGLPLSIYPNAGLPGYDDGRLTYRAEPEYFAAKAQRFAELGARIVGGCCGTTPQHIAAIAQALADSTAQLLRAHAPAAPANPSAASAAAISGNAARIAGRIAVQPVAPAAPAEPPAPAEPTLVDLVRQ